jgi:hypothetical protein
MPMENGGLINCRAVPDSAIVSNSRFMGGYVEDRIPVELVRHEDGETVVDADPAMKRGVPPRRCGAFGKRWTLRRRNRKKT